MSRVSAGAEFGYTLLTGNALVPCFKVSANVDSNAIQAITVGCDVPRGYGPELPYLWFFFLFVSLIDEINSSCSVKISRCIDEKSVVLIFSVLTASVHDIQFTIWGTLLYDKWWSVRMVIMSYQLFILGPHGTKNVPNFVAWCQLLCYCL